jgi:hypothetical protein
LKLLGGDLLPGSGIEAGFERLIGEYSYLDAWAGVSGFKIAFIDDPDIHLITVRHELPDPISATR